MRALTAVGDRYTVLVGEQVEGDPDEIERLVAAPMRAVFARGVESGLLRQDLPTEVLLELFGGALQAALRLTQRGQLGLEEASAACRLRPPGRRPRAMTRASRRECGSERTP